MIRLTHPTRLLHAGFCALALLMAGCQSADHAYDPYANAAHAEQDAFESAVGRPPTPHTLRAMARILTAQGKHDQASFVLDRIIKEHPRFVPAYNDLAELRLRQGRVEDAMTALESGLRLHANDATLWNNRGMCFLILNDYDGALQAFDAAVEAAPTDARFHANRAAALGMLGRYDESLDAYAKAVPPAEAHHNLALLCEARQDDVRAAEAYRTAIQLGYAVND